MEHSTFNYPNRINEILHTYLPTTWFYKHEIYEVPGLCIALLITYDDQTEDKYDIRQIDWDGFLTRMSMIKSDWASFQAENMQKMGKLVMGGWEGRTIYFIKGINSPNSWTVEKAEEDAILLLSSAAKMQGPMLKEKMEKIDKFIPEGREHYRDYEYFVRVVINYLFPEHLGEAKPQVRTEPGNEGLEIRDLICQNRSNSGFWKDLKEKYACIEILFDAKNKKEITRDDLRQVYCYLKPAIGLLGFIVCRAKQPEVIHAYNRTLLKNFIQQRAVLILSDEDLKRMIEIRMYGRDPSEYLRDRMSELVRSI